MGPRLEASSEEQQRQQGQARLELGPESRLSQEVWAVRQAANRKEGTGLEPWTGEAQGMERRTVGSECGEEGLSDAQALALLPPRQ